MSAIPNHDGASHPRPALAESLPPQNLECERGVLGACLLDARVIDEIIPILSPGDFFRDIHQTLWSRIVALRDGGRPVDGLILAEELQRRGEYEVIGGEETLASLLNSVPHAANAVYHAQIVRSKSVARALAQASSETLREVYSNSLTPEELIERAETRLFAVGQAEAGGDGRCRQRGEPDPGSDPGPHGRPFPGPGHRLHGPR